MKVDEILNENVVKFETKKEKEKREKIEALKNIDHDANLEKLNKMLRDKTEK